MIHREVFKRVDPESLPQGGNFFSFLFIMSIWDSGC